VSLSGNELQITIDVTQLHCVHATINVHIRTTYIYNESLVKKHHSHRVGLPAYIWI